MSDPYLHQSKEAVDDQETAISIGEGLIGILSIAASVLHYRGSKHLNHIAKFHIWHSLYCIFIGVYKLAQVLIYTIKVVSYNFLDQDGALCYRALLGWALPWYPILLAWIISLYYFFSRFDRILTRQRKSGRRGRLRKGAYICCGLFMTVYYTVMLAVFGNNRGSTFVTYVDDGENTLSYCGVQIVRCLTTNTAIIIFITLIEMVWLTACFRKVSYKAGWKCSPKRDVKMALCAITTTSLLFALVTSIFHANKPNLNIYGTYELCGFLLPSYFTLYFLWDRHYLGTEIIVNDEEDDDDDDDDDDGDEDGDEDQATFFKSVTPRETEMRRFSRRSSRATSDFTSTTGTISTKSNSLIVPSEQFSFGITGQLARDLERGFVLSLPEQSLFNVRALLNLPRKLFIDEDLRPPDSTAVVVHQFIANIALPVAQAYQGQHQAETDKLLERYRIEVEASTGAGADEDVDVVAALEKQALYEDLATELKELSLEVADWATLLQNMLRELPEEVKTTRDDVGVREGWRRFKPSSAKSVVGVAMWPTNLQLSNATIRAFGQRPLSLSVTTYGAPSAHAFGFKHGGWKEAEEKLFACLGGESSDETASTTRGSSSIPLHKLQNRSVSERTWSSAEALKRLQLKFNISGRSCVCMSQALAAAVAAAVNRLEECVANRDGSLVRQWVSIGLLVHEVSLLSTYGKEMGMIGDMATALECLNLVLRIERGQEESARNSTMRDTAAGAIAARLDGGVAATAASPKEGNFRVKSVKAVPQGAGAGTAGDDRHDAVAEFAANAAVVGRKVVTLEVQSQEAFAWLMQQVTHGADDGSSGVGAGGMLEIEVHPVLLTLGVNEMQTVANATGDTQLQTDVNRKGLEGLREYAAAFRDFSRQESRSSHGATSQGRHGTLLSNLHGANDEHSNDDEDRDAAVGVCTEMLSSLEELIDSEASLKQRKTVELLMQSCYLARLMKGCRTTSCKSAKDRTSMFHTLEVVRLMEQRGIAVRPEVEVRNVGTYAKREYGIGGAMQGVLDMLRDVNGVRLQNCKKNIGKLAFSFNKVQVRTLPKELQPLPWTLGGGKFS